MPVAFRSAGARLKADISVSNAYQQVAMPTHQSGDLLLLVLVYDSNKGPTGVPANWTLLGTASAGQIQDGANFAKVQTQVYYRVATSASTPVATFSFSKTSWPTGSPYVLAFVVAYSGVDPAGPVEKWAANGTANTAAAQAHPQLTTVADGDWLVSVRTGAAWQARTVTAAGGTNVERVDDTDGFGELFAALYDSGANLAPGTQTQRSTTAAGGEAVCQGGSTMWSLALKPVTAAGSTVALPGAAAVAAQAYDASVVAEPGGWDLCGTDGLPVYSFSIDWDGDGAFTSDSEDVTQDIISEIPVSYGRDQERQLSPAAVGSSGFTLNNAHRRYSSENTAGPLHGDLDPARVMRAEVTFNGQVYPLFTGKIDDYEVHLDRSERTASFTFLDGLNDLSGPKLSTQVYSGLRTGDLMNVVLDLAGWTGGRDIDRGASVVRYWWLDGVDALSAVTDLVKSEGPPAVAYVAPDGTFTFRDRHHRLLRQESLTSRATFSAGRTGDCDEAEEPVPGYDYTKPFTYAHGWRDIVNSVTFDVEERMPSGTHEPVWSEESSRTLEAGQSAVYEVNASEPFVEALAPVPGVDLLYSSPGAGELEAVLSRDSGASARLTLRAVGGPVTVTYAQIRARSLAVARTVRVSAEDPGSITRHGERAYPDSAPWANPQDAEAISSMILLHYARRRPTVQLRVVSQDPAHFVQVLRRTVSDRIRIVNGEAGLDDDFFVERVTHTIRRLGREGRPPVHEVVLGCEQDLVISTNPFTFDQRGSGFDQGVFDLVAQDDPADVFVFDDPDRGQFDRGRLGT